ncbi:hypothetical protein [Salmon gill poxvirus]|nr:hypothetical protein [Salmon gill poxvirus]
MDKEIGKLFITGAKQLLIFMSNGHISFVSEGISYIKNHIKSFENEQAINTFFLFLQKNLYTTLERSENLKNYEDHVKYLLDNFGNDLAFKKFVTYNCLKEDNKLSPLSTKTLLCMLLEITMIMFTPKFRQCINNFIYLYKTMSDDLRENSSDKLGKLIRLKKQIMSFISSKIFPNMLVIIAQALITNYDTIQKKDSMICEFYDDSENYFIRKNREMNRLWTPVDMSEILCKEIDLSDINYLVKKYRGLVVKLDEMKKNKTDTAGSGVVSVVAGFFGKLGSRVVSSAVARQAAVETAKLVGRASRDITESAVTGLSLKLQNPDTYKNSRKKRRGKKDHDVKDPAGSGVTGDSSSDSETEYIGKINLSPGDFIGDIVSDMAQLKQENEDLKHRLDEQMKRAVMEPSPGFTNYKNFPDFADQDKIIEKELSKTMTKLDVEETKGKVQVSHYKDIMKQPKNLSNPVNYGPVQMDNLYTLELLHLLKMMAVKKS